VSLNAKAWLQLGLLAVFMASVILLPAGTAAYWQAWVYLALFCAMSALVTAYLMKRDPELLKRRLSGGPVAEKQRTQKLIMLFNSLGFIALLVIPGLDHRFGWSAVPVYVVIAGDTLAVAGFYLIFLVYKENTFTSATIEIAEGQTVISTGPYARVRHPMYAGGLLYLSATPLALASYWGLLALAATLPFLIWRLCDEEKFLAKNLRGYAEYQRKVVWRLMPGVF
jgi:protein-S-isoprenylcysteine O-methyltransferase Ste14